MVPARDHCGDRGGGRFAGAVLSSAFRVGGVVGGGGLGDLGGGGLGDLGEAQGAGQERGHLGPGHRLVGAVAQGVGLAAGGDAGPGQGVDVGFVEAACGVGEPGRVGGCRQVEGAGQERGHLGPVHRPVRAEPQRVDQAARGDLQLGQALDVASQRSPASTSAKLDSVAAGGSASSSTRTSHTAIVQRSISSPGQNLSSAHSVPSNTPRSASASIVGLCTPPVTSPNPPGAPPPSS